MTITFYTENYLMNNFTEYLRMKKKIKIQTSNFRVQILK